MATLLADSPPAPVPGPPASAPPDGSGGTPTEPAPAFAPGERACANCGAALASDQDWCTQCGAGARGSLGTRSWRSAATVLGATAILVLGAAAAGYAALSKGAGRAHVLTTTVAATTPPAATTPGVAGGAGSTTPGALGTAGKATTSLPPVTVKPPKIPLTAATPKASEKSATKTGSSETKTTTSTSTTPASSTTPGSATSEEAQAAILLDTNAANTYNPYNDPASWFGDPSLAIDGDTSTAWTAQVDPTTAPNMADGLLIDLKSKQSVSVLKLVTATPGMTVQVFGANGHTVPASITEPAWIGLSRAQVVKKRHLRIALRHAKEAFTFVLLWISKVPESSIGTAEAPGHVSVDEVELFPAS
jgi:hypothetical protein